VKDLDAELGGTVKPPLEVEGVLNQSSWFLRDANWDVDVSQSAEAMTWFIEKETGKKSSVIIGISLNELEKVLKVTARVGDEDQAYHAYLINHWPELFAQYQQLPLEKKHELFAWLINQIGQNHAYAYVTGLPADVGSYIDVHPTACLVTAASCSPDFLLVSLSNIGRNQIDPAIFMKEHHEFLASTSAVNHAHQAIIANTSIDETFFGYVRFHLPEGANVKSLVRDASIVTQKSPPFRVGEYPVLIKLPPNTQSTVKITYSLSLVDPAKTVPYRWTYLNQIGLGSRQLVLKNGLATAPIEVSVPHRLDVNIEL
jgi:hypothetical protein